MPWQRIIPEPSPAELDLLTLERGLAPESCFQATVDGSLWIWDHEQGSSVRWQPSHSLPQARSLVFDVLVAHGWNIEYTHRAPGHLLQYDGVCHAWRGHQSETVFWGGKSGRDREAVALTRLACQCAQEAGW